MSSFVRRIAGLITVYIALVFLLNKFSQLHLPVVVYFVVLVFGTMTYFFYRGLSMSNEKHPKRFITNFMGVISLKLFSTILFISAYIYTHKTGRAEVSISTFLIYAGFTTLLISSLLKSIKNSQ